MGVRKRTVLFAFSLWPHLAGGPHQLDRIGVSLFSGDSSDEGLCLMSRGCNRGHRLGLCDCRVRDAVGAGVSLARAARARIARISMLMFL